MVTHSAEVSQRLMTVSETARHLAVSKWTVYRLVREGDLRAVRVGQRLRFRAEDLVAYLERGPEAVP